MSNKEHLPLLSKHRIIEHFHSSQAISILSQFSQIQSLSHGIVYTPSSKAKRETLSSTDQDHLSSLQTSKSTKAYGHSPLHGMSLEILGQVWSVEPTFPIINEAKKACATAAVEFFTAKNVCFAYGLRATCCKCWQSGYESTLKSNLNSQYPNFTK